MKFSVLMSVYKEEKPEYFERCMKSIWNEQTLKPNEIILIEDGQLSKELDKKINEWKRKLGIILVIISLKKNVGTGKAKSIGIKIAKNEYIAIMDTDDISFPDRFRKQINFFKKNPKIDVVGGWISEFEDNENNIISYRKVPKFHKEILKFAKKRNPINHPTAMYRKEAVLKAGNYNGIKYFEDYYLIINMLINGSRMENIQEPLVNMRSGFKQLKRRGGFEYIKNEIKFQNKLQKMGFINYFHYMQNIIIRTFVRIMPSNIRGLIYKLIRRIEINSEKQIELSENNGLVKTEKTSYKSTFYCFFGIWKGENQERII